MLHALHSTAANCSDMKLLQPTLAKMMTRVPNLELYADKGYDSRANRSHCTRAGFKDRIFKRRACNGRRTHAKRGVVERFFSWLDKQRRLIVRYEQQMFVYNEMTFLACGQLLTNELQRGQA